MKDIIVRLDNVLIENFKNVRHGELSFTNADECHKASVLGLYGQNGSGKTAMIDVIEILGFALKGKKIPRKYADYVTLGEKYAGLTYGFYIVDKKHSCVYRARYSFKLAKADEDEGNIENSAESKHKVALFDEVVSCSYKTPEGGKKWADVINTATDAVFFPKRKYELLIGKDKNTYTSMLVAKGMAAAASTSFIFGKRFVGAVRSGRCDKSPEGKIYRIMIEALMDYGNRELFVLNTSNTGVISLNALPLSFKYTEDNIESVGTLLIPLDAAHALPASAVHVAQNVVNNMNVVLREIIPGLTVNIKELGKSLDRNGIETRTIQLMSKRDFGEIPLKYESEGIKKIVSVLQLLITIYNRQSVTVAIDELDSGIFEYLLGELLKIVSEKGKGQLVFTSHNLRPLETINKDFVAFTTTDPYERYTRITNVKRNNNLRDVYYRDITLGGHKKTLYDATNKFDVELAFKEAGAAG